MPEQLYESAISKPPHRFPFLPLPFGPGLSVSCAHDAVLMAALMASSRSSWPACLNFASRSVMSRFCLADSSRLVRNGLTPIRNGQLGQSTATHLATSDGLPQQQSRHR